MTADTLTTTFAALADPTRRAMLARLADGDLTVGELAQPFKLSGPGISKHLKVLERAGLITRGREAQKRPCRLRPEGLKLVNDWLEDYRRRYWGDSFDRLAEYLRELELLHPGIRKELRDDRRK